MENNAKDATERLVATLQYIKEGFIEKDNLLKQSVLKSVVKVELKDILKNNKDYNSLKNAIQKYIDKMF